MREKYIQLIKEYINAKPDYKDTLREIKANVLTVGATEEEFDEALKQLSIVHVPNQDAKLTSGRPSSLIRSLITVDIISHFILIGIIILAAFFVMRNWDTYSRIYSVFMNRINIEDSIKKDQTPLSGSSSPFFVRQVYANTEFIDAQKVFSFPSSDITLSITGTPKKKVLGFFPYWMLSQQEKVSLDGLTSIILFGLEMDGKGNVIVAYPDNKQDGGWLMWNDPKLDALIDRAKRKKLSVELTLKCFDNKNIEALVVSDEAQKRFIANAIHLVQVKSLNGINLDFEYVGNPSKEVKDGFTRLVNNLRTELKRQLPDSSLSVDTYASSGFSPGLFDIELLVDRVDAIIVMAYDFHTPSGSAGPVSPMEGRSSIIGFMQSYLEKIPSGKLVLGVPYYGYDWSVPNIPGSARGIPYAQIVATSKEYSISWDEISQTPWYTYKDSTTNTNREVHFENTRSLAIKYDYVNKKDLQGIGIWALGYDGFNQDLQQLLLDKFINN